MMPRHSSEYGKSWRCATRSWAKGSLSPSGSCSTNYYRTHPSTSAVSAMSIKPSKVFKIQRLHFVLFSSSCDISIVAYSDSALWSCVDVVSLLRCTRQSLGIMASSRGALIGRLVLHEPEEEHIDCSILGPSGHAITGDLNQLSRLNLSSDARYLILVEKDAIFQRLAEDRLYNQLPCILITAKGYPDIATRFILHRLSQTFPNMPIFALVDWNPAGLSILCTYKYGSISMGLESYRYGIPLDDQSMIKPIFQNGINEILQFQLAM
uniref:Topoisomerase 6 subunit A/Spo11 TOPRIM domain-containing protein n=1 Tax=Aegilops tauschii subsp. strangulata TaxID=200361 RepID=A0A453RXB2_AEGTS